MKILPTKFTKNGFEFEQLHRAGDWAIYRKTQPGAEPDSVVESFELIRVQSHARDFYVQGNKVADAGDEFYPSLNS